MEYKDETLPKQLKIKSIKLEDNRRNGRIKEAMENVNSH